MKSCCWIVAMLALVACKSGDASVPPDAGLDIAAGDPKTLLAPSCVPTTSGGSAVSAEPKLVATLADRWHESWLASPIVADLDGDGEMEIIAARAGLVLGWHLDGAIVVRHEIAGRAWASPIVADFLAAPGLELAVAARGKIYLWQADGTIAAGFPVDWRDEIRSLAAGDLDGDGDLELVAVTTSPLSLNGQKDIVAAFHHNGSPVAGFPPNTSGASGCDDACYVTGGYDQNLALGDITGDGKLDVFAPHDNAYASLHAGTGRAFDAHSIFTRAKKFMGVRFLHGYDLAQQGYADDESVENQAHFTNSAPAIADIDGDGKRELVVLASVQNAAQSDRKRGVALWVVNSDGTRPENWQDPYHVEGYLAGLWDYEGTNIVAATNSVALAELDHVPGPDVIFAGFDGKIHAVNGVAKALWDFAYTDDGRVLTGGVVVADLSSDGRPEIIFASYSPDNSKSNLFILDNAGQLVHRVPLPSRGALALPTIADVDGDGALEIIVNLKDADDGKEMVLVYSVAGSADNCLPWPTARGNFLRNGYLP